MAQLLVFQPSLAACPQANALNLFTAALLLLHALRPSQLVGWERAAARWAAPAAVVAVAAVAAGVTQQA
jgi:hypothetical protein